MMLVMWLSIKLRHRVKRTLRFGLLAVVCLAASSLSAYAADELPITPLHLEGDTRACHGQFNIDPKTFSWISSWSACKAMPYHLLSRNNNGWTIETVASKNCPFAVINLTNVDVRNELPPSDTPQWNITGYETLDDYRTGPHKSRLSCMMM